MSEEKPVLMRLVCHQSVKAKFPTDAFELAVGPNDAGIFSITMRKVSCPVCKGTGRIPLLVTEAECDRCLGSGEYAEGGKPMFSFTM